MTTQLFSDRFFAVVADNLYRTQHENVDPYRFPAPRVPIARRMRSWVKDKIIGFAEKRGLIYANGYDSGRTANVLSGIMTNIGEFESLYSSLRDESSKETLIAVLAYRVLGGRRIKLPLNQPGFWNGIRAIENECTIARGTALDPLLGELNDYDLRPLGYDIRFRGHLLNVLTTFQLQQYHYRKGRTSVGAEANDVVIDGGGCWGDTALFMADRGGPRSRVICCEFVPENLAILEHNLAINPRLKDRITIVRRGLWDRSDEALTYSSCGPGTSVAHATPQANAATQTLAIDDIRAQAKVDQIDFIKLDIEGAESRTLQGAVETLKRFRPKLAVSLYHSLQDFVDIPRFLRELNLGYEFFIDHFTIHAEETVLFAHCPSAGAPRI